MFVGRETSPKKSTIGVTKFVTGTDTSEIGCGPDEINALAAAEKSLNSTDKAIAKKDQIYT